jgi:hypothetical protein
LLDFMGFTSANRFNQKNKVLAHRLLMTQLCIG